MNRDSPGKGLEQEKGDNARHPDCKKKDAEATDAVG